MGINTKSQKNFLNEIIEAKKKELKILKEQYPINFELERKEIYQKTEFFKNALIQNSINIIAEIKKASPSKGDLNINLDVKKRAKQYENAGASAISVLTEKNFFKGKNEDLIDVKETVKIPVLRKDFVIDLYQIFEAKKIGADAILLIADILDEKTLREFYDTAIHLGLDVLTEIHDEENLQKALNVNVDIIGINNRSLKTFFVDLNTTNKLKKIIPSDKIIISESGIFEKKDIDFLNENRKINGFLIGEALVKNEEPTQKLKELLS
ncbi:MAG: indole-3-glycerol phosphate synthase TrpC [Elusimicrobiota bacterium]|jgi:indole-3-glycerol phosphate synthase|nr:indole-3-glycerol phosphate synthase TrpC [Elusimicrobiota bacterium]